MSTRYINAARVTLAASALMVSLLISHAASAQSPSIAATKPQNTGVTAPAADIHDIRGPKAIPSPWLMPLLGVTALLAMGGAYAAWASKRRRLQMTDKRPLDIALERLEKARPLMQPLLAREFSIEVSSAVRDFIGSRFDLRAAHLTTDEFLHRLLEPADALLVGHRSLLDNFLQTCDLAKFGGWNLARPDMEAMLKSAREFVVACADDSKPQRGAPTAVSLDQPNASTVRETYVSLPSA